MIFFNQQGDEVGGLIYSARRAERPDRFGQPDVRQYQQDRRLRCIRRADGRRRAGLAVIDRPAAPLTELADLMARRDAATNDDDRATIQGEIEAFGQTKQRMYAGKNLEGDATLTLADAEGRERLVLSVDGAGAARIRFLHDACNVFRESCPDVPSRRTSVSPGLHRNGAERRNGRAS